MASGPSTIEQAGGGRPLPPLARAARAGVPRGVGGGRFTPYLFLAPYLLLFTGFVLIPAVYGFWVSLHDWDFLLPNKPWVGVQNYVDLFTPGSLTAGPFWNSMQATAIFTVLSVPLLLVLPLLVALLLNQKFRGRNFFRAVYFAPYVLGVAVIGVLWTFLLDANIGFVNYYVEKIPGVPDNIAWTTSLPWGWIGLVGVTVWWTLGYNAVIYLAGLQDIPRELYEAAKVDNAGRWARFRHVTLPGLRPVLVFVVTVTILASANMFGQALLITEGAPGNETRTAIMYIFQEGLRDFRMGNAAAMSYVLAFFLVIISLINFAVFRERKA
jgi:multiple sugar transport system permease protein